MIKPIENYTGYYVSDDGNIYSNLIKGSKNKSKRAELRELTPRLTKNGYARIYARNDITNKRKDIYIHRAVAEAFVDNPENKKYVNHKNCIRCDNRASNLEFVTAKENTNYTKQMNHIGRNNLGQYESNYEYKNPLIIFI